MKSQEKIWDKLYKKSPVWKKETPNLPNLLKGKSVLELGVGNGKTLLSILRQNPKSLTAIDFSGEALSRIKKSIRFDNLKLIKADITKIKFRDKFDFIICYYVINNLKELERRKAANSIYNSLKPKGTILFEDFAKGDFREKQKRKDGLFCHFFTKSELKSLFKKFSKIKISEKISSPFRANQKIKRKILNAVIIK